MVTISLPAPVEQALARLTAAGFEACVVGGAVRDALRGAEAKDWDVATSALPRQVEQVFSGERLVETGLRHGTVTVVLAGLPLEITTYRVDGAYTDHRRPDGVRFTRSLTEDMRRRDFTVNAMAYAPGRGLADPFGGQADLAAGVLRCVGEPDRRFQEDALRILRGLRFSAQLGMRLEPDTADALRRNRELLADIAPERVQSELTGLLCGAHAGAVLTAFPEVLAVPIPELKPLRGFDQHNPHHDRDVWAHTAAVVDAIPPVPALRWAALLHDVGKPGCFSLAEDGVGHFYGHAQRSTELAEDILRRLRLDNARRQEVLQLIRYHDLPIPPERKPVRRLLCRLGEGTLRGLIQLHLADTRGQSSQCRYRLAEYARVEQVLDGLLAEEDCFSLKKLAVNGNDLLALGLRGRAIGAALEDCLQAVLDERLPNRKEELLTYLRQHVPSSGGVPTQPADKG